MHRRRRHRIGLPASTTVSITVADRPAPNVSVHSRLKCPQCGACLSADRLARRSLTLTLSGCVLNVSLSTDPSKHDTILEGQSHHRKTSRFRSRRANVQGDGHPMLHRRTTPVRESCETGSDRERLEAGCSATSRYSDQEGLSDSALLNHQSCSRWAQHCDLAREPKIA